MVSKLKKAKKPTKSFVEIQCSWEAVQSLEIKKRFKAMRPIAHDICESYQAESCELAQLQFYISILKQINRIHDIPRSKRILSKMIVRWLELTGNTNVKIIKKISGKINLETASIGICDPYFIDQIKNIYSDYVEKNILTLINEGQAYIFSTGADGIFNFQVRIIEALEPVLTADEFKCVINTSEQAIIHIPTGVIRIADPCYLDDENEFVTTNIEPSYYKVCVYHFYIHNKIDSFYIVLCKTDAESKNNLIQLPSFG